MENKIKNAWIKTNKIFWTLLLLNVFAASLIFFDPKFPGSNNFNADTTLFVQLGFFSILLFLNFTNLFIFSKKISKGTEVIFVAFLVFILYYLGFNGYFGNWIYVDIFFKYGWLVLIMLLYFYIYKIKNNFLK